MRVETRLFLRRFGWIPLAIFGAIFFALVEGIVYAFGSSFANSHSQIVTAAIVGLTTYVVLHVAEFFKDKLAN